MTTAVCFYCGGQKIGPFAQCKSCGSTPKAESERVLSLALSLHLSTEGQLENFAREIKRGSSPSIPEHALAQSQDALKDSQLLDLLGHDVSLTEQRSAKTELDPQSETTGPRLRSAPAQVDQNFKLETSLHRNAFWILGATTRDDRRRIVELAEEKSFQIDHESCQKARADLTSPRMRLAAELAWLPGISPKKAKHYIKKLWQDSSFVRSESGLPVLAHANLMAAAFEYVSVSDLPEDVAAFIQEMASLAEDINAEDVLRDINEDRAVSGFPEIKSSEQIENELVERKRHYRAVIKDALNRMPATALITIMTKTVDSATAGGLCQAPTLIDELVDSYEIETQGFLQQEAENVEKLIQAARSSAKSGEGVVKPLIDKLETVARNWDRVAQPIQLSAKARGIEHRASSQLAYSIRSLGVDLFNEYDMLAQSQRAIALIQELFSELPEVAERVEQDVEALADIFENRKRTQARQEEWAKEITYRTDIGVLFKDTLSISPEGVRWKKMFYPLDAITRVRWGGIRHSVNGIPSGTTYTLAFGDNRSEAQVELKRKEVYSAFVDKLWRAVCVRLLTELLEALKAGRQVSFGDAVIRDDGVTLIRRKVLGANEPVQCAWHSVHIWSSDGSFVMGAKDDKKTYVALSYIYVPNVHILEQAIQIAFKKPGMRRLSEVLQDS